MIGQLLNMQQAAERLNTPIATLRYWILRGEGPTSFKLGRRRMFRVEDVEAFLAEKLSAA